jgi:radical SAM superfamily enzyme YgiQ (UPF0313 family)
MAGKIKKIALVNPKRLPEAEDPRIYSLFERNQAHLKHWYTPPLSLLIIASHTPKDVEVVLIDEHFDTIDFDEAFDLVGITAMTHQATRAYEIAAAFRLRGVPVAMGGIHASVLPAEALQHVDTVFVGEAEEQWPLFLHDLEAGTPKSLYKADGLFDLARSVTPRYNLVDFGQFAQAGRYFKFLPIQATRGCPHNCSFCVVSEFYGKKPRKKPVTQVVEDIKSLLHLHRSLFFFVDDNLFVDHVYARQLLKALIPLKIRYFVQTDVNIANDPELLDLAYQSGCLLAFIGFESIQPGSLSEINTHKWKMGQLQHYTTAIRQIQDKGIMVFGAFVLGFANDSLETFGNVRNFVLDNRISAQFTLLTPLPGTRVYKELKSQGRLLQETFWDKCSFLSMTFRHNCITAAEAEAQIVWLYDEVFKEENVAIRNRHMMEIYKKLPPRWGGYE